MGTSVKVDLPQTQTRHRTADETTTAMFRLASATLGLEQRKADKVLPMFGTRTLNHVINSHKALCFPVIGSMVLAAEQQHSVRAAVYLAMHGSYGMCWCLKYSYFPDWGFEIELHPAIWLFCFLSAAAHWISSWIVVNNQAPLQPLVVCVALCCYIMGMFFMYVADCQKYFLLRERKGLIADGVFTHTRNPNYMGEILIYTGFCLLADSPVPWLICVSFWLSLFLPNMLAKDKSLSRYKEFAAYKARSGMVVPWFGW